MIKYKRGFRVVIDIIKLNGENNGGIVYKGRNKIFLLLLLFTKVALSF